MSTLTSGHILKCDCEVFRKITELHESVKGILNERPSRSVHTIHLPFISKEFITRGLFVKAFS